MPNWFHKKMGLAIGLTAAGSGIGGAITSPMITTSIAGNGWPVTFTYMAIAVLIINLPFTLTVMRWSPTEIGKLPYGADEGASGTSKATSGQPLPGFTFAEAKSEVSFYMAVAASIIFGFLGGLNQNFSSMMSDWGFEPIVVGTLLSVWMVGLVIGKIGTGAIRDRYGFKAACFLDCGFFCVGLVFFLLSHTIMPSLPLTYAAAACGGFGTTFLTVLIPLLMRESMGLREYGTIVGIGLMGQSIGVMIGPPTLGFMYDMTGNYVMVIITCLILSAISIPLCLSAVRIATSKWKNKNAVA
jgi:MFS family permease